MYIYLPNFHQISFTGQENMLFDVERSPSSHHHRRNYKRSVASSTDPIYESSLRSTCSTCVFF